MSIYHKLAGIRVDMDPETETQEAKLEEMARRVLISGQDAEKFALMTPGIQEAFYQAGLRIRKEMAYDIAQGILNPEHLRSLLWDVAPEVAEEVEEEEDQEAREFAALKRGLDLAQERIQARRER